MSQDELDNLFAVDSSDQPPPKQEEPLTPDDLDSLIASAKESVKKEGLTTYKPKKVGPQVSDEEVQKMFGSGESGEQVAQDDIDSLFGNNKVEEQVDQSNIDSLFDGNKISSDVNLVEGVVPQEDIDALFAGA
jgi:hypothetical protein